MRVLIAVPDRRLLSGLGMWIEGQPEFALVGEVSGAENLLDQAQETQPDLVLLDWELRGQPAADLISALHALDSRPKVVVLSIRLEAKQTAMAAGADAFAFLGDPPSRLLDALHRMRLERDDEVPEK